MTRLRQRLWQTGRNKTISKPQNTNDGEFGILNIEFWNLFVFCVLLFGFLTLVAREVIYGK